MLIYNFKKSIASLNKNGSTQKNLIYGGFSGVISKVLIAVSNLVIIPLSLKSLNTNEYGIWMILLSIIGWLQLSDFGLLNAIVNFFTDAFVTNNQELFKKYLLNAFLISIIICSVGILLCVTLIYYLPIQAIFKINDLATLHETQKALKYLVILFFISVPFSIIPKIAYSFNTNYLVNNSLTIASIINILCAFLFSIYQAPLWLWAISSIFITIVVNIFLWLILHRKFPLFVPRSFEVKREYFSKGIIQKILTLSTSFLIFQVASAMVNNLANFIILHKSNLETVSAFNIVWRIQWFIFSTGYALTNSLFPTFRKYYINKDLKKIKQVTLLCLAIQISYCVLFVLLFYFFGDSILKLWLGNTAFISNYSNNLWLLLGLFLIVTSFCSILSEILKVLSFVKEQIGIIFLNGLVLNGLIFFLISSRGINGVIIAFITGASIASIGLTLLFKYKVLKPTSALQHEDTI